MESNAETPVRYIGIARVQEITGLSNVSIWRWVKSGKFPTPVYFGSRRAWVEADVLAWAKSRPTTPRKVSP